MGGLTPYWAFIIEYARCAGVSRHTVHRQEASQAWQSAKEEVREHYKIVAKDYNRRFKKYAIHHFSMRSDNLYHWVDLCRADSTVCGQASSLDAIYRECERWYGPDLSNIFWRGVYMHLLCNNEPEASSQDFDHCK